MMTLIPAPVLPRLDRLYKQLGNARDVAYEPQIICALTEAMDVIADIMVDTVRAEPVAALDLGKATNDMLATIAGVQTMGVI